MAANLLNGINAYRTSSSLAGMIANPLQGAGGEFSVMLEKAFDHLRGSINKSEAISAKSLVREANLVDLVTAISEAETMLQTTMTIRDKVITAYQDVLKMPV